MFWLHLAVKHYPTGSVFFCLILHFSSSTCYGFPAHLHLSNLDQVTETAQRLKCHLLNEASFWLFFLQSNMIFPTLNAFGINFWILCCFHCPFECKLIELGRASQPLHNIPPSPIQPSIMPEIYLASNKIFI